jgi:hypothetical protein
VAGDVFLFDGPNDVHQIVALVDVLSKVGCVLRIVVEDEFCLAEAESSPDLEMSDELYLIVDASLKQLSLERLFALRDACDIHCIGRGQFSILFRHLVFRLGVEHFEFVLYHLLCECYGVAFGVAVIGVDS